MKPRKASTLTLFVVAVVVAVVVIGLTMVFTAYGSNDSLVPKIHKPTQDDVIEKGYPVNENGETYGPNIRDSLISPDLELAINEEGVVGYIRQSEIGGAMISSPEEAAVYFSHDHYVNMYTEDGKTVIGMFLIKGTQGNNHEG